MRKRSPDRLMNRTQSAGAAQREPGHPAPAHGAISTCGWQAPCNALRRTDQSTQMDEDQRRRPRPRSAALPRLGASRQARPGAEIRPNAPRVEAAAASGGRPGALSSATAAADRAFDGHPGHADLGINSAHLRGIANTRKHGRDLPSARQGYQLLTSRRFVGNGLDGCLAAGTQRGVGGLGESAPARPPACSDTGLGFGSYRPLINVRHDIGQGDRGEERGGHGGRAA